MDRTVTVMLTIAMVISGINAAVLFTVTLDESGVEHVTVTVDLEGLLPAGAGTLDVSDHADIDYKDTDYTESEPPQENSVYRPQRAPKLVALFNTDTYFVVGDEAYCTDVLGTAKISHGLALGGILENPEGRTDTFLTNRERDQGNLIIVGGPAVNPAAVEFGGYFGISYKEKTRVGFTIFCERKSIHLDFANYPHEDICIVYLGELSSRNVLLVWGYSWRGTYAGSVFMGDPVNWQIYEGAHMLLLRWKDYNRDGFVQQDEIIVEQYA
jgi:hypothetical protein